VIGTLFWRFSRDCDPPRWAQVVRHGSFDSCSAHHGGEPNGLTAGALVVMVDGYVICSSRESTGGAILVKRNGPAVSWTFNNLPDTSFASYGKRRNAAGWTGDLAAGDWTQITATTRRGYTEHEMLDNLTLEHVNGRAYDPVTGRFMSADPYVTDPMNSQSFNRYSYVLNNPLALTDPSGLSWECIGGISSPIDAQVNYSCGYKDDGDRYGLTFRGQRPQDQDAHYIYGFEQGDGIPEMTSGYFDALLSSNGLLGFINQSSYIAEVTVRGGPGRSPGIWDIDGLVWNSLGVGL
jgi:RHS repeat-associated protein